MWTLTILKFGSQKGMLFEMRMTAFKIFYYIRPLKGVHGLFMTTSSSILSVTSYFKVLSSSFSLTFHRKLLLLPENGMNLQYTDTNLFLSAAYIFCRIVFNFTPNDSRNCILIKVTYPSSYLFFTWCGYAANN